MSYLYKIKKKLYFGNVISRFLFRINGVDNSNGRDKHDESVNNYLNRNNNDFTVSAIYRVKNGEEYVELSILSVAHFVNEIIFIDNGSTDNTLSIVSRLKDTLKNVVEIKIFSYHQKTALAGEGYIERVNKHPEESLAKYYNYAFSLGSGDYLMKCDAHYIFIPSGLSRVKAKLEKRVDVLYYSGVEMYGKEMSLEPFIFKNNGCFEFVDDVHYERLRFSTKASIEKIFMPVFFHVKRLSYIKFNGDSPVKIKYGK